MPPVASTTASGAARAATCSAGCRRPTPSTSVEAVEFLARRAGIELTEEKGAKERRGRREELIRATAAAVEFYHERLRKADDAAAARSYLRGRGYEAEVVERFEIGYSPDTWDTLTRYLKAKGFSEAVARCTRGWRRAAGRARLIDRFRGRLMFPIYDLRGDAVGFGARLLEGDGPKYLNSPETPIYQKSRLLYGLNWAKSDIVRSGEAVVVEGYTDVIAFHLADLPVAVATCGTALGEDHLDLLRRFTERVVLAFDADEAGAGAALRGFEKVGAGRSRPAGGGSPGGAGPCRPGARRRRRRAARGGRRLDPAAAVPDRAGACASSISTKPRPGAERSAPLPPFVALHPDPVVRHEYAVMLSRRTGVDLAVVEQAISQAGRRVQREREADVEPADEFVRKLTGEEKAELELLRLVLANDPGIRRRRARAPTYSPCPACNVPMV